MTSAILQVIANMGGRSSLPLAELADRLAKAFSDRKVSLVGAGLILGQMGWESDHFRTLEEYATGEAYEGRVDLGNTQPGDGRRFKGRGLLEITGRGNYRKVGQVLGVDLEAHPELLLVPEHAVASAVAYLDEHKLWEVANRGDVLALTHGINGGTNGYLGRLRLTCSALASLGVAEGAHV